jgi:MFS transporter, DHA1 family, multidrug resistance protein
MENAKALAAAVENDVRAVMTDRPVAMAHPAAVVPVLAALSALGTLATNILLPSLPGIGASLHVSSAATTQLITVFLGIFAVGQLVVGPLSDRYGRRVPVLIGFVAFVIGSVICAVATELPGLLFGRVIQAAGACATSVLSRAIARDLFSGAALAKTLTLITIAMAAAPGFSPLLGGTLDHFFGWRSSFYFVAVFAVVAATGFAASFGETLVPNVRAFILESLVEGICSCCGIGASSYPRRPLLLSWVAYSRCSPQRLA